MLIFFSVNQSSESAVYNARNAQWYCSHFIPMIPGICPLNNVENLQITGTKTYTAVICT